ncbi:MAG: hypothetical protein EOP84_25025 [Verrucomicrobiaceae bacterium]|nr:MAG: hypothetical protein EOP84_25025 [Verrucomicrobiaceae bacterium]
MKATIVPGRSAAGKTKLGAIFTQGAIGTPVITAVQGGDAPGQPAAKYKSFLDPVISPAGRVAFIGTLQTSKSAKPSLAVFSTITGTLARHLQQGQEIPGMAGIVLKSVSGISIRGTGLTTQLVVLASITGQDVGKTNNVVLLGVNVFGNVTKLLRTGEDELTVDDVESQVTGVTTLTSAKGSTGHGRWQSDSRIAARVTLADKRTVLVTISGNGTVAPLVASGDDSAPFGNETTWKTLGLPTVGTSNVAAALVSATGKDLSKGVDTGLVYTTNASTFSFLARKGDVAAGTTNAKYASFSEPLVSSTNGFAFMSNLTGGDTKGKNKTGIWSGTLLPQYQAPSLLARQGDKATDSRGEPSTVSWSSFLSLAHPGGANSGPIFLAKVAGKKNNIGLWAQDSSSKLRQVVRVGDSFGGQILTRMVLLQGTAGVSGATRSFNDAGGVGLLLSFKDKSQAIYYLGIP